MYNIDFYETSDGYSEAYEFLEALRIKARTIKDARIQLKQVSLYIQLLQENGTNLPVDVVKHIDGDIWELRPGNNRVFFFYFCNSTYVLLHHYRKKTQKTPKRELAKAKKRNERLHRKKGKFMNWEEYKNQVKQSDPVAGDIISTAEVEASIITAMINQRKELGISQRDLASLCNIPQSSVARIESNKITPRIDTLLNLLGQLGLTLKVERAK